MVVVRLHVIDFVLFVGPLFSDTVSKDSYEMLSHCSANMAYDDI